MIEIKNLEVMQDGFRLSEDEILKMIEFVLDREKFTVENLIKHNPNRTSLIAITQFEDGRLFIRDGFHRTAAIIIGRTGLPLNAHEPFGLRYNADLFDGEYVIEQMTYDMYLVPNIHDNWYTPFDPRTEVRKADFFDFKKEVLNVIKMGWPESKVNDFILENKHRYAVPRQDHHKPFKFADLIFEKIKCQYTNIMHERTKNVSTR